MPPHRWQPTRLCHPWDSSGKNTGVGCHFCIGLVTSNCLFTFDAHSEQIDLNLDKIKVLKPFPLNCCNLTPYLGVLCYGGFSSFLFKNIFTDWDGWDKLLTVTIETAGYCKGFSTEAGLWAIPSLSASNLYVCWTCVQAKKLCLLMCVCSVVSDCLWSHGL